jgi:hypothetical protein
MMSEEEKFIMSCNYAVIAVNSEGKILHSIFQEHKPTEDDFLHYEEELATDEELGMMYEDDYILIEANEPTLQLIKKTFREERGLVDG